MKMKKKWIVGTSLLVGALLSTSLALSLQTSKVDAYSTADLTGKTLEQALELENAFFIDGAQVRLKKTETDKMGIRFGFKIDESIFENYLVQTSEGGEKAWKEGVEIGTVWMPYDLLQGAELTLETENVSKVSTELTKWTNAIKEIDGEEVGFMQSFTYMYDIPATSYHRNIGVRGYVKDGDDVYYTKLIGRSLSWVAYQAVSEDSATYYDSCKEYLQDHTVTYYVDGGSYQSEEYQYGNKINVDGVETPKKSGYKFNGWYRDSACEYAWDFDKDVVTGATRLYADWKKSEQKTNDEFVIFDDTTASTYELDTTNATGRATAYKYVPCASSTAWAGRLELKETSASKNANGDAQVARDNITALGYEWALFDLYQSNAMTVYYPTQSGHGNVKLSAGTWTNNEFVKVYQNGYAVTKLAYNQWYTVAVKLTGWKGTYTTSSVALGNYTQSACWIDNVRYYYGDTFTSEYKSYGPVSMTEFSAVNSGYVSFGAETTKFDAALGAYHYQSTATDKYEWDNRIVFATSPSTAVTNGYKYISFDIYVEESNFGANKTGYVYLSGYTDSGSLKTAYLSNTEIGTGTPTIFTPSDYIKLYANGEEVTALQAGGWTTVVVALEQLDTMVFYLGCRFGGEFWLKDARLYQTQADYQKDYKN